MKFTSLVRKKDKSTILKEEFKIIMDETTKNMTNNRSSITVT